MSLRHRGKSFHRPLHAVAIISTIVGSATILVIFIVCGGRRYDWNSIEAADATFGRGVHDVGGPGDRRILIGAGAGTGNLHLARFARPETTQDKNPAGQGQNRHVKGGAASVANKPSPGERVAGEAANAATVRSVTQPAPAVPEAKSVSPSPKPPLPFRIFQASPGHTGSTLMTNILQGLFEPHANLCYTVNIGVSFDDPCPSNVVIKTHPRGNRMFGEAETWAAKNGAADGVFIISTNRGAQTVGADLCAGSNVLCLEYEDFTYANDVEMRRAVSTVADGIRRRFPYFAEFGFDVDAAVGRLRAMDRLTKEIEDEPFSYYDKKFGIHGGHRKNHPMSHQKVSQGKNSAGQGQNRPAKGAVGVARKPSSGGSVASAGSTTPRAHAVVAATRSGSLPPPPRPPLPFRIIQASRAHTGSTLMMNILQGLFEPDANLCYTVNIGATRNDPCPSNVVLKTHPRGNSIFGEVEAWAARNGAADGAFVISTNRGGQTIGADLCAGSNVLCFEYEDFTYANDVEMRNAVRAVARGIRRRFPYFADFDFNVEAAFRRLKKMEMLTKKIEDEPFSYYDKKFGIHGGHRKNHPMSQQRAVKRTKSAT